MWEGERRRVKVEGRRLKVEGERNIRVERSVD
jgi:hypothetical protein